MQDIIATLAAQYLAETIFALATAAIGAAGAFALAQLTRLLGEKRMALLSEKLTGPIQRAQAAAEMQGLTGERLEAYIIASIKQTMAGTIRKLRATDDDLSKRVLGQVAASGSEALAGALARRGVPAFDAVVR